MSLQPVHVGVEHSQQLREGLVEPLRLPKVGPLRTSQGIGHVLVVDLVEIERLDPLSLLDCVVELDLDVLRGKRALAQDEDERVRTSIAANSSCCQSGDQAGMSSQST